MKKIIKSIAIFKQTLESDHETKKENADAINIAMKPNTKNMIIARLSMSFLLSFIALHYYLL